MVLKKARSQLAGWGDDLDIEDVIFGVVIIAMVIAFLFFGPQSCSFSVGSHTNPVPSTTTTTVQRG